MKQKNAFRMPIVGIVWIVLSAVTLLLALSGYIMTNLEQILVMILGAVAVVGALLAGFAWDAMDAFRKGARAAMIVVPALLVGIGLLLPLYVAIVRPEEGVLLMNAEAPFGYNLVASLAFMLFIVQVLEVFFLPMLAAAASFGNRFDVWHYRVHACVNVALLAFNIFVSATSFIGMPLWNTQDIVSPSWYIPNVLVPNGGSDLSMVQVVVLVTAVLTAGLSFLPLPRSEKDDEKTATP